MSGIDQRGCAAFLRLLFNLVVCIPKRRELRQVRDAKHLAMARDIANRVANHLGDGAANGIFEQTQQRLHYDLSFSRFTACQPMSRRQKPSGQSMRSTAA